MLNEDENKEKPVNEEVMKDSAEKSTDNNDVVEDSDKDNNETIKIDSDDEKSFWTKKKIIAILVVMLILVPGVAIGSSYLLSRYQSNQTAETGLKSISSQKGDIRVSNTKLSTFKGQKISSANIDQKSLTNASGMGSDSAVFVFSNGKENKDKKIVDVYLDFSSQKSRDFILLNQSSLKRMVENNLIELRLHPVPSASSFSIYAAEAISESIVTSPDKTWDFVIALMKTSATLNTDKNDDVIKAVLDTVKEERIDDVDAESIKNGTFASWILAVGDDNKLKTGYYPPIIYLNDKAVDPDDVFLNDSSAFQKYVLNEEKN